MLGDKQKFVSCFLTLAVEVEIKINIDLTNLWELIILNCNIKVDTETMEPTGKLSSAARDWVQAQGSNATTVQEVVFLSGYQYEINS